MGVKALTNFRMKVLKISRSSKLLSVFGTSKNTQANDPLQGIFIHFADQIRLPVVVLLLLLTISLDILSWAQAFHHVIICTTFPFEQYCTFVLCHKLNLVKGPLGNAAFLRIKVFFHCWWIPPVQCRAVPNQPCVLFARLGCHFH